MMIARVAGTVAFVAATIGAACAAGEGAAAQQEVAPELVGDPGATKALLTAVRTDDALLCTMVLRAVDMGGWSRWGGTGDDIMELDSAASGVLRAALHRRAGSADVALLEAGIRDSTVCVRRVSASVLARLTDPSARIALRRALEDSRPEVRSVAALGLGMVDSGDEAAALLAKLRDGSAEVRRAAAWALGAREAGNAERPLVEVLSRDPDARVRQAAAWSIGQIGGR